MLKLYYKINFATEPKLSSQTTTIDQKPPDHSTQLEHRINVVQKLVELLLLDNYSNVIEPAMIEQMLNNSQSKALRDYAENNAK
ncbi:hypothetical protein [Staphylococcus massiliensis]|uniref:hypothetical protein n=1 Tax=Staphylococcus massiliensis TaxID=555791 RepID=UPI001EE03CDB|nr:hypothetical protein [Staphylococcus massiliensis]MCG3400727.1 hypothetical protein [Staphylococcus massiliensis]